MADARTTELAALATVLLALCFTDDAGAQCGATPRGGCLTSRQASLLVRDTSGTDRDRLKWKWAEGDAFAQTDLGAPATTTTYRLCVYDSTGGADALVTTVRIDPSASWTDGDPKGWVYKDLSGAEDGVRKAQLKTGASARTKVQVLAKGEGLVVPTPMDAEYFDEDPRVVVQLVNDATAACWSSVFESASKNVAGLYKAKSSEPPATTTSTTSTTSTSTTTTTGSTTTTNTLPPGCPDTIEIVMHAGVGAFSTATDLDLGWTGNAHDRDLADGVEIALRIASLAGTGPSSCGEATIGSMDPVSGNCRCNHDSYAECQGKVGLDPVGCGTGIACATDGDCKVCSVSTSIACLVDGDCPNGEYCRNGTRTPTCSSGQCVGRCDCFLAPPEPISSASSPLCIVRKLAADVAGTWNVDSGQSELVVPLRLLSYYGESIASPCPVCAGDVTVDDGVRDGTCVGGQNDGSPCDADALDATYPLPTGGAHSYDCYPSLGRNHSGTGLDVPMVLTTGSVSLSSGNPCGYSFAPETCPCGVCSDAGFRACSDNADCGVCTTNADCSNVFGGVCGPGNRCSCGRAANGKPRANQCTTGVCLDLGDGVHGECDVGPDDTWCDGALQANGMPIVSCLTNADCDITDCSGTGTGGCGGCSITTRRQCFLDPIVAGGSAGGAPMHAGLGCMPRTSNAGVDALLGLPGPLRMTIESTATIRCPGGGVYPPCPQ